jgi:hypothetical protein
MKKRVKKKVFRRVIRAFWRSGLVYGGMPVRECGYKMSTWREAMRGLHGPKWLRGNPVGDRLVRRTTKAFDVDLEYIEE